MAQKFPKIVFRASSSRNRPVEVCAGWFAVYQEGGGIGNRGDVVFICPSGLYNLSYPVEIIGFDFETHSVGNDSKFWQSIFSKVTYSILTFSRTSSLPSRVVAAS